MKKLNKITCQNKIKAKISSLHLTLAQMPLHEAPPGTLSTHLAPRSRPWQLIWAAYLDWGFRGFISILVILSGGMSRLVRAVMNAPWQPGLTLSTLKYHHTCRQIKNDQPGSHDFRRFLRQFWTDFHEILQRSFSITILTVLNFF